MRYRKLGRCDFEVSEISLGCWTLGGPNWAQGRSIGWRDVDEGEAIAAIHRGLDMGVTHFDNADVYGNGKAERVLANALEGRTETFTIATKVGWHTGTAMHAYEPAHIRHQCEQSLINLKREVIDLYYFHHGGFGENDIHLHEAVATMRALRDEGKIRHIGLSAYSEEDFQRLVPKIEPDALQSAAHIMDDHYLREGSPVQQLMKERGLSFVAFSPLNQGLLLGKFTADNPPQFADGDHRRHNSKFEKEALQKLGPMIAKLKERFGGEVPDLARVALQYLLSHAELGCVIPGFRNVRQVESNLAGADNQLSADDVKFVRELFADG